MGIVTPVNRNMVQQDPLSNARLRPADFGSAGEQVGRAVQGLGQDIRQFAAVQDEVNDRYDTAGVKRDLAAAQAEIAPARTAMLTSTGVDAVAAKGAALAKLEEVKRKYGGMQANPRRQRMFEDAFTNFSLGEHAAYDEHEIKQSRVAAVASAKSLYETNFDRAIDLRASPDQSKQALADAIVQVKDMNPGAPPEVISRLSAEAVSEYRTSVAAQIRDADGDPLEAEHYINEHAGEILPKDEADFRRSIKADVEEATTDAAYGEVLELMQDGATGEPDAVKTEGTAKVNSNPLRGRGGAPVKGGTYGAARDGGARSHGGVDYPAPAGTPVQPPAGGVVEKVWFDAQHGGGNSVVIRHPDGRTTGYAHLRSTNVKAGEEVTTDTVIGGVGNTGTASHGNHLHFTVRGAGGQRVDPMTQNWDGASNAKGATLPRYSSERIDVGRGYEIARRVAVERGLTTKQFNALISRVDNEAAKNDNIKRRAEEDAVDGLNEWFDKNGSDFTSETQIPSDIRKHLPPGKLDALRERAKQNIRGDDSVRPGGDTFMDVYEMSGNAATQDEFSRMDLTALAPRMSRGEFTRLRKAQIDIRNGGGRHSDLGADYSRVDSMVNRYAPQSGGLQLQSGKPKVNDDVRWKRAQVSESVRRRVADMQQKAGRKLTEDELAGVVRSEMAPVFVQGTKDTVPRALTRQAKPGVKYSVSVPNTDRQQIIAEWRRTNPGRPITEGMIAQAYLDAGGGLR